MLFSENNISKVIFVALALCALHLFIGMWQLLPLPLLPRI